MTRKPPLTWRFKSGIVITVANLCCAIVDRGDPLLLWGIANAFLAGATFEIVQDQIRRRKHRTQSSTPS